MKNKIIIFIIVLVLISTVVYLMMSKNKKDTNYQETFKESNIIKSEENTEVREDLLGILKIEKIGLEAPVKEGSTDEVLKEYIGHIEETPTYNGNVCLAAHNRGDNPAYFKRLNELIEGDIIIYKTNNGSRNYKVERVEVILETDWTLFANTKDNRLTMLTCIINRPSQRLCVQAVEI